MFELFRACLTVSFVCAGASPSMPASPAPYAWRVVADSAASPGAYNFPVFPVRSAMWAFHPQGNWSSADGRRWVKSPLPPSGLNSGYQKYVVLHDAVYALGTMTGNHRDLHLTSRIARTRDFRTWETVAPASDLPARVFYGAVTFRDRVWLLGGYDGQTYYHDVWSSPDAVHWTRETADAGWSARNVDLAVVFKDKLWIIGGGVIDGQREPNPNAKREAWSSSDGVHWEKAPDRAGPAWGGTPVVFDDQLWLAGANRNSTFAPAVWVFRDTLFMTGGKYSVMEHGAPRFIYRNDVWQLTRASR